MGKRKYKLPTETIYILGGHGPSKMAYTDPRAASLLVANPGEERVPRTETIELPLGPYEDLRVRVGIVRSPDYGKYEEVVVDGPEAAAKLMEPFCYEPQEVFSAILLNNHGVVVGIQEIHRGGLVSVAIEPQSVFKAAIVANASSIIVVHNHPSGKALPSTADVQTAAMLVAAGQLLQIPINDFMIVAREGYVSLGESLGDLAPSD